MNQPQKEAHARMLSSLNVRTHKSTIDAGSLARVAKAKVIAMKEEGKTVKEIATLLVMPIQAVKNYLYRGRV